MCCSKNIHAPPIGDFFGLNPPSSPHKSYVSLKLSYLGFENPLFITFYNDLPWVRRGGGEGLIRVSSGNKQRDVQLKYRHNV